MKRRTIAIAIVAGMLLLALVGAAFVVASSHVEHRRLVAQERDAYPAPGTLVDVSASPADAARPGMPEGGPLHVYAQGAGGPTLVFLSGLGTSSPYFDFKPLFERLSENYRIAVVERAGYGWSEITSSPRDLDTVLRETRTALQRAGEEPPYVLFPHSLAGLEALSWANRYPEEVPAVIGLDPLVPEYHERAEERASLSRLETILARAGLMRSGPDVFARNFPAMVKGRLSEQEAVIAETIFMRRTHTRNMWAELRALPQNAALVRDAGKPDVPVHVFVSDAGSEAWKDSLIAYAQATGGEHFVLDAGHYLHLDDPDFVAETSRALIEAASGD